MTKRKDRKDKVPAGRQRIITVRSVRKENPDVAKLASALIAIGLAEAEKNMKDSDSRDKAA